MSKYSWNYIALIFKWHKVFTRVIAFWFIYLTIRLTASKHRLPIPLIWRLWVDFFPFVSRFQLQKKTSMERTGNEFEMVDSCANKCSIDWGRCSVVIFWFDDSLTIVDYSAIIMVDSRWMSVCKSSHRLTSRLSVILHEYSFVIFVLNHHIRIKYAFIKHK